MKSVAQYFADQKLQNKKIRVLTEPRTLLLSLRTYERLYKLFKLALSSMGQ